MTESIAINRAAGACELCSSTQKLREFDIPQSDGRDTADAQVAICEVCAEQMASDSLDDKYWLCLQASAWSAEPAVQVLAFRLLKQLKTQDWAVDLADTMFMEDDTRQWAQQGIVDDNAEQHRDCNGALLTAGDTVTIVKDLDVKGTSFVAKRGTAVRNISLSDNPAHIEGRVNGTRIVLLTQYVKKSN